jgi:hypothetical protein
MRLAMTGKYASTTPTADNALADIALADIALADDALADDALADDALADDALADDALADRSDPSQDFNNTNSLAVDSAANQAAIESLVTVQFIGKTLVRNGSANLVSTTSLPCGAS